MANLSTKDMIEQLVIHLQTNVEGIQKVTGDFPDPNVELVYPSITVMTRSPEYSNLMPYQLQQTDPTDDNKINTLFVVGQYEYKIQIDLWCRSKQERAEMFENLFKALNPDIEPPGLTLTLKNYYGVLARYDFVGFQFEDEEITAQRQEWRAKLDVLGHHKAIRDRDDFAIKTIDPGLEVTDTVSIE